MFDIRISEACSPTHWLQLQIPHKFHTKVAFLNDGRAKSPQFSVYVHVLIVVQALSRSWVPIVRSIFLVHSTSLFLVVSGIRAIHPPKSGCVKTLNNHWMGISGTVPYKAIFWVYIPLHRPYMVQPLKSGISSYSNPKSSGPVDQDPTREMETELPPSAPWNWGYHFQIGMGCHGLTPR